MSFKIFTAAGATVETVDVTAGENLAVSAVVYLSVGAGATTIGRAYLTDADAATTSTTAAILGIVTSLASDGTAGTVVTVQLTGTVSGLSSLTAGKFYGLSSTAGALALTAALPTIGYATSTTELQMTGEVTGLPSSVAWTPAAITTRLWLDASDASTITESGGAVSQWADKSGNSNNATQGTGTNQPNYGTNVVEFDGVDNFMNVAHGVMPDSNEASMVFVVGLANGATESFVSNGRFSVVRQSYSFRTDTTTSILTWFSWADDINVTMSTAMSNLSLIGIDLSLSASTVEVYQDGTLEDTLSSFTGIANAGSELGIIGNAYASSYLDGDIREIVIVMGEPVTATRQKIEGYLAHRWSLEGSLPAGHPYKAAAPTIAIAAGSAYKSDSSGDLVAAASGALGYALTTTSLLIRGQLGSTAPA